MLAQVLHKMMHGELVETTNWLPKGKITIGITSGGALNSW
jgi:4-hydroxy-3-methylbut-2-enyl diphosphate reductase